MTMICKIWTSLLLVFLCCAAQGDASWEGDLAWKTTWKDGKVTADASLALSQAWETVTLSTTWKADEKGFSSLQIVGEAPFGKELDARAELLFKPKGLETIKLKGYDLPLGRAELDLEGVFKDEDGLSLYEVSCALDGWNLGRFPASADLLLRNGYVRAGLELECRRGDLEFETTCKERKFDQAKLTVDWETAGWSVKEALLFKPPLSPARPQKGTLTASRDLTSDLALDLVCDHAFSAEGIAVTKLVPALTLELDSIELVWKGTFAPSGQTLALAGYTFSLTGETEVEPVDLVFVVKVDEEGLDTVSVRISVSLSR